MPDDISNPQKPPSGTGTQGSALPTEVMRVPPIGLRKSGPQAGDVIGSYELQELIGEGGFGIVFVAEQRIPVRRRVALKILKFGIDNTQLVARFNAERQAVALMDHAHIAKVLDAGTTDQGQPYFVMELIRGIPITDFCRKNKIRLRQRLELFKKVCDAVQHAHQKGIIHRDLKPSNVLVTAADGVPIPKVIDFGVAKALHGRLTDSTIYTDRRQLVGTPEYMSPEQADDSGVDVDTRSDVYSLGVLLYELLTGTTPLDREKLRTAGYGEMRKMICEAEPLQPSTRVAQTKATDPIAEYQLPTPHKLASTLRRELDWITMRCLEKDPKRRYPTANDLAQDIERYLTDEPVEAKVPSAMYRMQRFAKKHRAAFRVTVAALLLLVAATAFSINQALRATRAEARARNEATISRAVNDFLKNDLLSQASPFNQTGFDRTPDPDLRVRDALDNAAARVGTSFADQPRVEVALRNVIGSAYRDIGQYEKALGQLNAALAAALPSHEDDADRLLTFDSLARLEILVGHHSEAETQFLQAVSGREKLLGPSHPDTLTSRAGLAMLYVEQARFTLAEPLLKQTLAERQSQLGERHRDTIESMRALGNLYVILARYGEAQPILERALEFSRQTLGPAQPDTLRCMSLVASLYAAQGALDVAEPLYLRAVQEATQGFGANHPQTLVFKQSLGNFYQMQGRYSEAEPLLISTLAQWEQSVSDKHPQALLSMVDLANLYRAEGKYSESLQLLMKAMQYAPTVLGPLHPDTLRLENGLGALYRAMGRYADAEPPMIRAWDGRKKSLGENHPNTLTSANNLANLYEAEGRYDEAEPLFVKTLQLSRTTLGEFHPDTLRFMNNLGVLYDDKKDYEKAEPLYRQALEGYTKTLGESHPETLKYRDNLGVLQMKEGRFDEAAATFDRGLSACQLKLGKLHPETLRYLNNIGVLRMRAGHADDAEGVCRQAYEGARSRLGKVHPETLKYLVTLTDVFKVQKRPEDAIPLIHDAVEGCARTYGETDSRTITWKSKLDEFEKSSDKQ